MCCVVIKWLYWHKFFDCQSLLKLRDESLQWFSSILKIDASLTLQQCSLNLPPPNKNLSDKKTKDLRPLLLYAKQYHNACKTMQKKKILLNSYRNLLSSLKWTTDLRWQCCPSPSYIHLYKTRNWIWPPISSFTWTVQ